MTQCIVDDVRAQAGVDVDIVVIDDGSTDGTAAWLARQPDILIIRGNGNLWWAGAVDAGLRRIVPMACDDDYALFLNSDTSIRPDFVSTLVRVSRDYGGACVGTALRDRSPPHALISIGPRMNVWHMRVWDVIDELSASERSTPKPAYDVDALSGRGTLYPIRVFRAIGYLYPKLLPHYHADYELAARARRHGFRTLASTEAVVYTDDDFGVHRAEASTWKAMFKKGAPNNPIHRVFLWLMLGTPLQRATALPRMILARLPRSIEFTMPAFIRFGMHAGRLAIRALLSGEARARLLRYLPPRIRGRSYNAWHAYTAGTLVDVHGGSVLVVGCNVGKDCGFFVRLGAAAVHGLDVIKETGQEYKHRRVRYLRASAEQIPVRNGIYDLVFCFTTMEHVSDIDRAFAEMARVTKEGGVIYSVAAPLWNSRYGHHKGDLFERFPWIHLRMNEKGILELCERENIRDATGRVSIDVHVRYMLDRRYFNMTAAQRYVQVCTALQDIEVVQNSLSLDEDHLLSEEIYRELEPKGYSREELLAVAHTFIGRKRAAKSIPCAS